MLPIHTILVPTEFSVRSEYVLQLACALREHGGRVIVLHVVPPSMAQQVGGVLTPEPSHHEGEHARLQRLQAPDPEVPVEKLLMAGDPAVVILQVAQDYKCDLIVMGTHGRTGLARLLMGSIAEQVVRKAPCPVVTVKTPLPLVAPPTAAPAAATN